MHESAFTKIARKVWKFSSQQDFCNLGNLPDMQWSEIAACKDSLSRVVPIRRIHMRFFFKEKHKNKGNALMMVLEGDGKEFHYTISSLSLSLRDSCFPSQSYHMRDSGELQGRRDVMGTMVGTTFILSILRRDSEGTQCENAFTCRKGGSDWYTEHDVSFAGCASLFFPLTLFSICSNALSWEDRRRCAVHRRLESPRSLFPLRSRLSSCEREALRCPHANACRQFC